MRTTLPRRLDPDAIEQAPSLEDSPLDAAVLAVGTNPAPYSVEGVAVMSPRGAWRVIDRYRLGMRDPDIVEQQYSLSPDGRTLALGDAHGIVLVDIRTAGAVRVPVEANDLVLHAWTPNGSHLIFTPRSDATKTLLLDVADRTVTRAGFRAWASSVGPAGQIAELLPRATSPRPTHTALRILEAGNETVTAPLGVQLSREPRIGRQ